jgi:hypothetical protein
MNPERIFIVEPLSRLQIDMTALLPSFHSSRSQAVRDSIRLTTPLPTEPAYRGSASLTYHPVIPSKSRKRPYKHLRRLSEGKLQPTSIGRRATRAERHAQSSWRRQRRDDGLPCWVSIPPGYDGNKGKKCSHALPGPTPRDLEAGCDVAKNEALAAQVAEADVADLQQWCAAYCKSLKDFRQFVIKKEVWGWQISKLEQGRSRRSSRPKGDG